MSRPAVAHLLFGLVCSLAISCSDVDQGASDAAAEAAAMAAKRKAEADRAARIDSITRRFSPIGLRRDVIRSASHLDSIRHAYAPTGETYLAYRAFATVNRKDIQFFRIGDTVMIPDTIMSDRRAYSVFPQYYEHGDTIPKIVFVSNKWQAYACYEYGELVRFAAVNSGEERKPTFPGRYAVNWKARLRLSSLDSTWRLPYTVNFHQYAGLAFHQFEMPGRPVSHSCVRQFLPDAEWLFKWVRQAKFDSTRRHLQVHLLLYWTCSTTREGVADHGGISHRREMLYLHYQKNRSSSKKRSCLCRKYLRMSAVRYQIDVDTWPQIASCESAA